MKKILYKILFSGLLVLPNVFLFSQTDNEQISYSQESTDSSDYNYKRKYMYLDINMKEENKMFSVGISPNTTMSYQSNPYNDNYLYDFSFNEFIKFENKIIPVFSSYAEIIGSYSQSKSIMNYSNGNLFSSSLNLGFRYYFLQKHNISMNISSSNFNGPYIDVKLNSLLSYFYQSMTNLRMYSLDVNTNSWNDEIILKYVQDEFNYNLFGAYTLSVGYQQKLTKYLLMDGSIFFMYNRDGYIYSKSFFDNNLNLQNGTLIAGFSFKFGLGWGWK